MPNQVAISIQIVFLFLIAAKLHGANPAEPDSPPNIVFILVDDLGYGDLGCYNSESKIATPNIDQLARQGVLFTDAHAGGAFCIPSRYSLLTGQYSVRMKSGPALIQADQMTIATLLRDVGYRTAMVGKWHLGFDSRSKNYNYTKPFTGGPVDCGFDTFFGMHASLDIQPYFFIRDRTVTSAPTRKIKANTSVGGVDDWSEIQGAFWREGLVGDDFQHNDVTPRFVQEAINVIQSQGEAVNPKPLFLYLALPSPHTPWLPKEKYQGQSGAGMYGDFVMQVDDAIGEVLAALDETNLAENTLVIVSSDNGPVWREQDVERFGHRSVAKLRGSKFSPYEGGHRMPFIVRWPEKTTANSVCHQTIAFSDVLSTFAHLASDDSGLEALPEDSVSFLPYLLDPNREPEKHPPVFHNQRAMRDGEWKLVLPRPNERKKGKTSELYNLKLDLSETTDLSGTHPEIVERMKLQMEAIK